MVPEVQDAMAAWFQMGMASGVGVADVRGVRGAGC